MAATAWTEEMQEPSIDTDKLSYEIFSILESKFLFDQNNLWIPKTLKEDVNAGVAPITKTQKGKICILSIDGGGGMRGIIPGKALAHLEQLLKAKSGKPEAGICDFFDIVAGSGVGGIFASMLFGTRDKKRPVFNAEDTWRFLADNGKHFYREGTKKGRLLGKLMKGGSSSSGFEKLVRETFGSLTLKDTLKPVLIPCYDMHTSAPFLFSRADALESNSFDFRLWEVCCATSAEPGVLGPVSMRSVDGRTQCMAIDGCLAMSNPTAAAITHVLHNKQEFPFVRGVEDMLVLSLGTGQIFEVGYDSDQVKGWKPKQWVRPMARIAGDGSADSVDQAVSMAFGHWRNSYVRIQANGSYVAELDDGRNVRKVTTMAEEMLKQKNVESVLFGGKKIGDMSNAEKLDWFAGELVLEHQRRALRRDPTVAFKQAA